MNAKSKSTDAPSRTTDAPAGGQPRRRLSGRLWAVLGALGILSTVGAFFANLALDTARDRLTEPLVVDVREADSGPNYLFGPTVDPADAPIDGSDLDSSGFRRWADARGGVPYHDTSYEFVFRGRDPEPVVIQDIGVKVLERSALPAAPWVNSWEGCGAAIPVRLLTVSFAADAPQVDLFIDGVPNDGAVLRVSDSDVEVVQVDVTGGPAVVSWVFVVTYSSAGRDGTLEIEKDGSPFRIAGGGDPEVFSTLPDPNRLTRYDEGREGLRRGEPLC
jgi:hypothetical protein